MRMDNFSNTEIARMFREMALLYEIKGERFKPQAYNRGADTVENLSRNIVDLYKEGGIEALLDLPGIGKGIASHIVDMANNKEVEDYEDLKKEIPVDVIGLTSIESVGPKTVKVLFEKLGVTNVDELESAVTKGLVEELDGFGKTSQEKMAEGIAFVREVGGRMLYTEVESEAFRLKEELEKNNAVERVLIVGSFRRKKETVGDIDFLIISEDPEISIASDRVKVEVKVTSKELWASSLIMSTGSKEHVDGLVAIAKKQGLELSEIIGETEEEIYKVLGLSYIEPELRENTGEVEASLENKLPTLIAEEDIKGDLQMHTEWSDGVDTIEERARFAITMGYEYIAITDHTQSLRMTGGLDEAGLRKQMKEIDEVNQKLADEGHTFRVLKSAEVNIMKDGTLDVDNEVLSELDMAGGAVHSHFDLSEEEQTARVIKAIQNPYITIINHPTSRLINKRKPILLNFEDILKSAKKNNVALEIDAQPSRLDLSAEHARACVKAGVKLVISSDAHSNNGLHVIRYGVNQARRAWVEKKDVINTYSLEDMLKLIKR